MIWTHACGGFFVCVRRRKQRATCDELAMMDFMLQLYSSDTYETWKKKQADTHVEIPFARYKCGRMTVSCENQHTRVCGFLCIILHVYYASIVN